MISPRCTHGIPRCTEHTLYRVAMHQSNSAWEYPVKGHLRSKKTQMKEREKCKKTSHYRPQCAKWFSRYSISKSGIWARWISPFCRFSASFSIKYDVTDAILQDNEKMKVQCLRSLLFDLFETLQAVRAWQRNSASFQNQNYCILLKKQKVYCLSKSDV